MMLLRQSTVVVVPFGPCLDKTDGVTHEVGLVSALDHGTTGIMLSKNGSTLAVRHAAVTASTYDAHGCYKVTLDTTDSATLGHMLMIYTDPTTCLPVWMHFQVVTANVYDSLFSTDVLNVSVTQWLGTGAPALNNITVGELLAGDLADGVSFPTNSLADLIRKLFWVLCNNMVINDATGAFTAYKTDGTTPGRTGTIVDDGTNTARTIL